ncbi:DGQHR domain-containing protein [Desulfobacterales bacterium HSG2]|nr:DGQHR domain-containing protein [Desulfobacterales bacterium HSG2]
MIQKREYYGFRLKQRKDPGTVSSFVFTSGPKDIIEWSCVDRLAERREGIQRRISDARLRAIRRFFSLDPVNMIPTSIVLAFQPGTASFTPFSEEKVKNMRIEPGKLLSDFCEWGILSFEFDPEKPEKERPAFVVDGQHRLLGMAGVEDENLPVLVSALLGAELMNRHFSLSSSTTRLPKCLPILCVH